MKPSTFLRPLLALTMVAGLTACGGGNKSYVLAGTVAGLNTVAAGEANLVLANGSSTLTLTAPTVTNSNGTTSVAGSFTFAFTEKLGYGDKFNVVVQTQPAHQTCQIGSNTGTAGTTATNGIVVACNPNTYTLGGTITGLTGAGLVLNNGADTLTITPVTGSTPYVFGGSVADGSAYGVTILTQPVGQVCVIPAVGQQGQTGRSAGTMGSAKIENILIVCVNI